MSPAGVRAQVHEIYSRLIATSLSVKQNYPSDVTQHDGSVRIGDLGSSIALKNVPYGDVYDDLDANNAYHIKFPDGGLLIFQYSFDAGQILQKHRLAFFPSPVLPTIEEAPELYEQDELYGDILLDRLVRFPIRFDYDPANHQDVVHPKSHLTLGQFDNCRIPVVSPVTPNSFVMFLLRNFYVGAYRKNMNRFERKMHRDVSPETITPAERRIGHFLLP